MAVNVAKEVAALERMTSKQLREKYLAVFGEESRSGHTQWLVKRIAWRIQANAEGDLSQRARQRALELANDADLRTKAPRSPKVQPAAAVVTTSGTPPCRELHDGLELTRQYKGRLYRVTVRNEGFEFEGERYKSLSAVAKTITGSHTSGNLFFKLGQYGGDR
jgi:hypothetical protein